MECLHDLLIGQLAALLGAPQGDSPLTPPRPTWWAEPPEASI